MYNEYYCDEEKKLTVLVICSNIFFRIDADTMLSYSAEEYRTDFNWKHESKRCFTGLADFIYL